MKILHLTLKKKWFDMVGNGKVEEYREIKPYWTSRLCCGFPCIYSAKDYDQVVFKNGYTKDSPVKSFKWDGLEIRTGNPEWGAEPYKKYFVIKLGKQLS